MAFAEGNRLGVPVILDTDAQSKCDKYVHLGMELAGTRRFGQHGVSYDLIKYPDQTNAEENVGNYTTRSPVKQNNSHPPRTGSCRPPSRQYSGCFLCQSRVRSFCSVADRP